MLLGASWPGRATAATAVTAATTAQLESESPDDRRDAMARILATRQASNQQIADLLAKYLVLPGRTATAKDLILVLGRLRAAEQVPILL